MQPQVSTQHKSPMTMADLGLPARTGATHQMPLAYAASPKHAVIPLLGSPIPGQAAATSPEATPSRAQLFSNVPKQVLSMLANRCPLLSLRYRCRLYLRIWPVVHEVLIVVSEEFQYRMQEGTSSLFSPKLKKHKSKVNSLLQRLEDAQVSCLFCAPVSYTHLTLPTKA